MTLTITSATRVNGAACDHLDVVVNVEGQSVTARVSFEEIDALVPESNADLIRALVCVWAAYRRQRGRSIVGVTIA